MRIVFAAILWGIGGTIFGAVNGAVIGWALGLSPVQIGFILAGLGAVFGIMYGAFTTPRKVPVAEADVPAGKSKFSLEPCAWCKGTGLESKSKKKKKPDKQCRVCYGRGNVLVEQPSQNCPKCKGKGKRPLGRKCNVCDGAGWDTYAYFNQADTR